VVFPAPLGPRNPKTSPRWTSRSSASTAVIDEPYRFVRPWVVMTFPFAIGHLLHKRTVSFTVEVKRTGVVTTAPDLWVRCEGEGSSTPRVSQAAPGLISPIS